MRAVSGSPPYPSAALVLAYLTLHRRAHSPALAEARLQALQARIRPHFLFNSLNSISGLATSEPVKAQEMCVRLADFLRKSLAVGERTRIDVSNLLSSTWLGSDAAFISSVGGLSVRQWEPNHKLSLIATGLGPGAAGTGQDTLSGSHRRRQPRRRSPERSHRGKRRSSRLPLPGSMVRSGHTE